MKSYIKLILILLIPLLLVIGYTKLPTVPYLEKIKISNCPIACLNNDSTDIFATEQTDSTNNDADTTALDTTAKRILFFGDSMLEGLAPPMSHYTAKNGHELHSVCWYSSTTKHWALTDTLEYFLNKVKPDYVIVSIGGNEQFVKDLDKRLENIKIIQKKIGNIPTVWLCTPEWKPDREFNIMLQKHVGNKHFFDSRKLKYQRKKDHAHPTAASSVIWMDSIAVWLQSPANAHPIRMEAPTEKTKTRWDDVRLSPMKMP